MKAFFAHIKSVTLKPAIVFGDTASKARYVCYKALQEAGYDEQLTGIRICRAKKYDAAATDSRVDKRRAHSEVSLFPWST